MLRRLHESAQADLSLPGCYHPDQRQGPAGGLRAAAIATSPPACRTMQHATPRKPELQQQDCSLLQRSRLCSKHDTFTLP
jgi:hypothetical protein